MSRVEKKSSKVILPLPLAEFAEDPKLPVERLAKYVEQGSAEELQLALAAWPEQMDRLDPDLLISHVAVHALLSMADRWQAFGVSLAERVLRAVLGARLPDSSAPPSTWLWQLSNLVKEGNAWDPNPNRYGTPRGQHLFKLGVLWLAHWGEPRPLDLPAFLGEAQNHFRRNDTRAGATRKALFALCAPKPVDFNFERLAAAIHPWEARVEEERPARERLEAEVTRLEARLEAAAEKLRDARQEATAVLDQLAESGRDLAAKEEALKQTQGRLALARQDLDQFKGSVDRLLAREVAYPLETALEALHTNPPVIPAVNTFIEETLRDVQAFRKTHLA